MSFKFNLLNHIDSNENLNVPSQTWNDVAYTPGVAKSLFDQTILLDSLQ